MCPYARPDRPHGPHEYGPALEPLYCPGTLPAGSTDPGPLLVIALGLFALAFVLLAIL